MTREFDTLALDQTAGDKFTSKPEFKCDLSRNVTFEVLAKIYAGRVTGS